MQHLGVVFPSDYFNKRKPDEMFLEQVQAFSDLGFAVATISLDDLKENKGKLFPRLPENATVLYRGWMLSGKHYQSYVQCLTENGTLPFTTVQEYLTCHHIPNWYPYISNFTPETVCFEHLSNLETQLNALNWQGFFIKDYVKSLKTSVGSRITSPSQINSVLTEMEKFRGEIEGGICIRRIENFDADSEQRYFVLNGVAYSSNQEAIPEIVNICASIIPSKFFSVDTIKGKDGKLRIVEIGDGQVSDLVGWTAEGFAQLWKTNL